MRIIDWPVFMVALTAAFLGELPCLARTASVVIQHGRPLSVVLGTLAGNALLILPVLLCGEGLHRHFPERPAAILCGLVFIGLGIYQLCFHPH